MDLRKLTPTELRKLADQRLSDLVIWELPRARRKVRELERRFPSADRRELANRLIDEKKSFAAMVGGVTGVFGLASVPFDLLAMAYVELVMLVEVAIVYRKNLKSEHQRNELLDLFGESNGVGPLTRSTPRAMGTTLGYVLTRSGAEMLGRAMPVIAAPISAWYNNRHVQQVGDAAVRHYEGFGKARQKLRREETAEGMA